MSESKEVSLQDGSTYFMDAENAAEMARLMTMAQQITEDMETLFPPHLDPSSLQAVLDIACGPGQWTLNVARTYPHLQATGVDISQLMIAYATTLIKEIPNAHFQNMNAQQSLDFADTLFDFIQARLITSFMLTSSWPKFVHECKRILNPGGTLCLIEGESFGITNSASLEQYNALLALAMRRADHCFAPEGNMFGITAQLPRLLENAGFQNLSQTAYALNFSAGKKANETWYTNYKTAMKLVQPFLLQWEVTTQPQIDILYERALHDILLPTFCGQWFYLAVSGTKPA